MNYAIFDLDGCLSDDRWRRRHLYDGDYNAYNEQSWQDMPANLDIFRPVAHNARPIFVTARPVIYFEQTVQWIQKNLGLKNEQFTLLMRPGDDARPSPDVKVALLRQFFPYPDLVIFAADDREDVLAAYEEWGVEPGALHRITIDDQADPWGKEVMGCMRRGIELFEQRNAQYKDSPQRSGAVMAALYPDGLCVNGEDSFAEMGILVQIVSKLSRFATSGNTHLDSIRDLKVYAAMLEAMLGRNE